ncbi:HD-GYP domain-containing protein [bacterium]|nr:HD-GYP domain-containing protein [bacterium]
MQLVPLYMVKPGAALARSIPFGDNSLLTRGTILTSAYINALRTRGVFKVYIETDSSYDAVPKDVISEETRNHASKTLQDVFTDFSDLTPRKMGLVTEVAHSIVDELLDQEDLELQTHDLRSFDDYTYRHSVNVTVISLMIGKKRDMTRHELNRLAVAGLMHDIGKMKIPISILNKNGRLSSDELVEIRKHPDWGFSILAQKTNTDPLVWSVARQHHEMGDGSGYPDKLDNRDIHPLSKLLTVADIWDALRSDRPYKSGWSADKVIDYMKSESMLPKLDIESLNSFMELVKPFPLGTMVKLSDGREAVVVCQDMEDSYRPVIRVSNVDEEGNTKNVEEIILTDTPELSIISSI